MNLKKLYANTHPFHIFIALWNLLCLVSFVIGLTIQNELGRYFGTFALMAGALTNLVAIIIALVLIIKQLFQLVSQKTFRFASEDYLGLFNGAFVIFFWFCFINLLVILNDSTL